METEDFRNHNFAEMKKLLTDLSDTYTSLTRLSTIGQSVQNRDLYVMEVTEDAGAHSPKKPEVKLIANMHGNESVGREMLLLLIKYLCQNYGIDERVTKLLRGVRLHVMPSMNPDGYEISHVGDFNGLIGRNNAHRVDLNRNFPDQYGRTKVGSFSFFNQDDIFFIKITTLLITGKSANRARDKSSNRLDDQSSIRLVGKLAWRCFGSKLPVRREPSAK